MGMRIREIEKNGKRVDTVRMNLLSLLFREPTIFFMIVATFVLVLSVHEYSHALVSSWLGDSTAERMHRLTLNPLSHIDPIGFLMLIVIGFGWGKPVPVDVRYLSHPKRDMLWIAIAGPTSNVISAALFGLAFRYLYALGFLQSREVVLLLYFTVQINFVLAFFNMIPLPPLDGSKVLAGLLPFRQEMAYRRLEQPLSILLIALIIAGAIFHLSLIGRIIMPPAVFLTRMLMGG